VGVLFSGEGTEGHPEDDPLAVPSAPIESVAAVPEGD
jgi:hypothetical protein